MRIQRISRPTGVVTVGMLLLFAASATAAAVAQPVPLPSDPAVLGYAKPPPLPPGVQPPSDTGKPDLTYEPKVQCVRSLNSPVDLINKPWGQNTLRFDELHKFADGEGQTVAVIDTGVNPHDFLGPRLSGGGDYVVADNKGLLDCDGHGTEVAGIIAADPDNPNIGFTGIAPKARIVSIRQSSANYTGKDPADPTAPERTAGNLLTLAQAIVNAADKSVDVINMSVDNCRPAGPITIPEIAVQAALRYAVEQKDVVVVSSAGNLNENGCNQQNGPDPNSPNTIVTPPWFSDYVISVAAMDKNGEPAQFSVQGPWVSVAAPGTEIISLDPGNSHGLANLLQTKDNKQSQIQGTSFAAPYVAGLAALIRQRYPELSAKQVMNRILVTASHPAATGGRDIFVGHGMINPIGALTAMIPSEQGIPSDKGTNITFETPAPIEKNWTPVRVALLGSAGGVALLLLTLFVVHTVRASRRNRGEGAP